MPPGDSASLATTVLNVLVPSGAILRRLADRIQLPESLANIASLPRVMAGPQFPAPLALALIKGNTEYLFPGLGNFPDDSVTLLETNSAFVEAFLAGANGEMNRELLWREYPTDRRGTPFRCFWPRPDGLPDIPPISQWGQGNALGQNMNGQGIDWSGILVLLVRGEILRRFPRTVAYAAPGRIDGDKPTLDDSIPWTPPEFVLKLDSNTTAFAYPLTEQQVRSDFANQNAGFYFRVFRTCHRAAIQLRRRTQSLSHAMDGSGLGQRSAIARLCNCEPGRHTAIRRKRSGRGALEQRCRGYGPHRIRSTFPGRLSR